MKSFYVPADRPASGTFHGGSSVATVEPGPSSYIRSRARIAVYDAPAVAPRVEEVEPGPVSLYIDQLSTRVYELARSAGGSIPFTVIREVAENFIHADFAEPVVTIMDDGATVRFADQGPGIPDKERAVQPGFTTARGDMKRFIRGVGSGLPIVRDYLSHSGGSLVIEDNLGSGSVVTVRSHDRDDLLPAVVLGVREQSVMPPALEELRPVAPAPTYQDSLQAPPTSTTPRISTRQKQVLALVLESGSVGPSLVAKELGVGVSTAYRDLASLEELGLISSKGGKRDLTELGASYFDGLVGR